MSTRTDDASDEAEAERMERWWGPKDFTVRHSAMDGRRSGVLHYGLQAGNGGTIRGRRLFREIAAPERLVFVAAFSDEKGGAARDPFPGEPAGGNAFHGLVRRRGRPDGGGGGGNSRDRHGGGPRGLRGRVRS